MSSARMTIMLGRRAAGAANAAADWRKILREITTYSVTRGYAAYETKRYSGTSVCAMKRFVVTVVFAGVAFAQLPVKRVVLYKNGVGYFEHVGRVQGNQEVAIPFTSGQLNDVLKSLTVLDLGGGRITGVGYGSSAPVDRQLGDLRLPIGEHTTLTDFLGALRGARVEIRSGT